MPPTGWRRYEAPRNGIGLPSIASVQARSSSASQALKGGKMPSVKQREHKHDAIHPGLSAQLPGRTVAAR